MTDAIHECALCHHRTDQTSSDTPRGHLCARCAARFLRDLDTIAAAWRWLADHPGVATGTNAAGGSDPPLPGGTGRLAYLYDGWAAPWGGLKEIVRELRYHRAGDMDPRRHGSFTQTIAEVRAAIEHCWDNPHIVEQARRVSAWAAEGTALCGWGEAGQWVTCPNETDQGECGRRLRIDMATPDAIVVCRQCQRTWTAIQLLNVAAHSDGWADPASAAEANGVTVDQVNIWARNGAVQQQHSLVSLADVRLAKAEAIAAGTRRLAGVIGLRTIDPSTRCPTCGEWADLECDTPGMVEQLLREWRQMHAARHAAERPARRA